MSPALILYAVILVVVLVGLWGAYRVLGTPSRLTPPDYAIVLDDLIQSVGRAASQLRDAVGAVDRSGLEDAATASRRIFQTGYYQTLRLRPSSGPDRGEGPRLAVGLACSDYEWASRMASKENLTNPAILDAVVRLIEAGDWQLKTARELLTTQGPPPGKSEP